VRSISRIQRSDHKLEEPDNWPGLVYHGTLLSVHVSHASLNQRQRNGAVPKHRRSKSPRAAFGGHSRWALRIPFRLNGKKKPRRSGALSACSGVGLLRPRSFRCWLRRRRVRIGRHRSSRRRGSALAAARGFRCRGRGGARSVAHHRKHNKSCNDQGADDSRHDPTGAGVHPRPVLNPRPRIHVSTGQVVVWIVHRHLLGPLWFIPHEVERPVAESVPGQ
jgi:hypothetical protein